MRPDLPQKRTLLAFCAIAALGFLPVLSYYYVGEEAIFPIVSLEMWQKGIWLKQIMYGADVQHNPLFNWLIILVSEMAGWSHVLEVTRALAISATLGSAWVLYRLTRELFDDERLGLFASLVYLTFFDVSLYHGWLAYVDPLFSFLVFFSIALLWIAARKRSLRILAASILVLSASFLAKAFTAYVFYAGAVFVLLFDRALRKFLLSPGAILAFLLAAGFPFLWLSMIPSSGQGGRMFAEISHKLELPGFLAYLRQIASFPLEVMLRLSPALFLALYYVLRGRVEKAQDNSLLVALAIGLVNLLPYWFSPHSGIRYILPIYPFFALAMAHLLWRSDAMKVVMRWIAGFIALRMFCLLFVFPWYQSHYRGENYMTAAKEIVKLTSGYPLYVTDVSSSGMSVAGYVDTLRLPEAALIFPPAKWSSGFVIAYTENPELGKTYKVYRLGGDRMYLLCRGGACSGGR